MKVTGIITNIYPVASGTSKNGNEWRRQNFIVNYDNSNPEYSKSIAFYVMNDNIEKFNLQQGSTYELDLDFSAREYNGRLYMEANCWRATEK